MEKRRLRSAANSLTGSDDEAIINAELIDHLTEAVLENAFVATLFQIHRELTINKMVGLREEEPTSLVAKVKEEAAAEAAANAEGGAEHSAEAAAPLGGRQQRGGGGGAKRQNWRTKAAAECKCKCFVCGQMIVAVRFAPHLEKCIGNGRTVRTTRRGIVTGDPASMHSASADGASTSISGRTTRSSTLRSASKLVVGAGTATTTMTAAAAVNPLINRMEDFTLPPSDDPHPPPPPHGYAAVGMKREGGGVPAAPVEGGGGGGADGEEEPLRDRLRNAKSRNTVSSSHTNMTTTNSMAISLQMRAVVQRVSRASVVVEQQTVSSIGRGICVLVGMCREDTEEDIEYIVRKLLNLRLFECLETQKRWNKSVKELELEVLCVSQFTLHASLKGNKLDFHQSMGGEQAPAFYAKFMERLRGAYQPERVKDGKFGAMMSVLLENDGPVTINLESKQRQKNGAEAMANGKEEEDGETGGR